ncbi:FMN-binding negative transcriptional regulator [Cellulophaga baltica]|uniref:FMN-binding negative transcriptional regulator n=1 Tax=Cellulophaga TaxID=104264 RepID=UPI001C07602F|nr:MULTISPECIES: FMN-binding negative transcriptional regulator [Cellulophaga]MBU2997902.1 FMN-binding negative transcriptional regulator [Cellulophaga baltica]MDO6769303.1 FMN-binding negative transcriptional regulator [Cellulophaga sp. 1_MG-2023]
MYTPEHYKQTDHSKIIDFIKQNGFGILINQVNGKPWATHIPLELDKDENNQDILVGHIARVNPQAKNLESSNEVLCIFNGPHSYISSSWYKEEEVPTWDYIAVHVYGKIAIQSEKEVLNAMAKLVDKYEQNSKKPDTINSYSEKTLRQVKGVIGFKILISDIQATYKLSQTRTEDHDNIINELKETNDAGALKIAEEIKESSSNL